MNAIEQQHLPTYDHRRGTGPTLVFLHYWGGSARTWDLVTDRLDRRDILTIDFRGWGRSKHLPGPYTLQEFADDVLSVLDDAAVSDHVRVGHSMGGKVAQLVAATHPAGLRGVILVGSAPAVPPAEITPHYCEALSHAYDSEESIAQARDQVLSGTPLPEAAKTRILIDSRACAGAARTEWPLRGITLDISERTRTISVPALVVAGAADRVEPESALRENLVRYLPQAEFRMLPHSGHLIPFEAPAELAGAITQFAPANFSTLREGDPTTGVIPAATLGRRPRLAGDARERLPRR